MTTSNSAEIEGLLRLCEAGRLYDVEAWIRAGRPIQLAEGRSRTRRPSTPLAIAIESGNHSLALLLLANGYDPNAEECSPLDQALEDRRWDLVDLLLEWQTDPRQASADALFGTYRTDLFEQFANAGFDFTRDHALAFALSEHTTNKPLFGFAKRHRDGNPRIQAELDSALAHHAAEGNEKGVQLCLWAGADPHAPARSIRYSTSSDGEVHVDDDQQESSTFVGFSAIREACSHSHVEILRRLRPDPAVGDFDDLYSAARDTSVLHFLSRIKLPDNQERVILSHIFWFGWEFDEWRSMYVIEELFRIGCRLRTCNSDAIADMRRTLLKLSNDSFVRLMRLLTTSDNCSPEFLAELARTPAFRAKMEEVGFLPRKSQATRSWQDPASARAREVVRKCGVELPKERVPLPSTVYIGQWSSERTEVRLERAALYELVWSEPVSTLAKKWGISDRGLGKALGRLQIPVPPRGHWARVASGKRTRRIPLPTLPKGEAEHVVILVPAVRA